MKRMLFRAVPCALALCVAASLTTAQNQPAPPAGQPVVVGRLSVASLDAVNKFIADLGIPLQGMNLKDTVEDAPFLGTGSVAMDKPMGIVVLAGDPHKLFPFEDSIVGSVPVVAGKATAANLTAAGATAVAGTTDTFTVGGESVRRTTDYIHVKPSASTYGLAAMTDAVFAPDYRDATNLFVLSANFDVFRKSAPEAYKDLAKQIISLPRMFGVSTPDDSKPVEGALDRIDRFTLAFGQDDINYHLKSWLAPSPLATVPREMPRPAFPAGMIMRTHIVYPTPDAAAFFEKQLAAMPDETIGMPEPIRKRVKALMLKAAALNTRSDAISVAFAMKDRMPVVYVVAQFNADVDALKEIEAVAREGVSLAADSAGTKLKLEASTYEAGGKRVQRLALSPEDPAAPANQKVIIDEIQSGRTLYVTMSLNSNGKYVVDLASAGMDGKSNVLCAGAIDLAAVVTAAEEAGGLPGLSPDQLQTFKTGWAGQGITWTLQSSEQNFLYTDVQVPRKVVRDLVRLGMATSQQVPVQPVQPGLP